jgi:hypothetical protein
VTHSDSCRSAVARGTSGQARARAWPPAQAKLVLSLAPPPPPPLGYARAAPTGVFQRTPGSSSCAALLSPVALLTVRWCESTPTLTRIHTWSVRHRYAFTRLRLHSPGYGLIDSTMKPIPSTRCSRLQVLPPLDPRCRQRALESRPPAPSPSRGRLGSVAKRAPPSRWRRRQTGLGLTETPGRAGRPGQRETRSGAVAQSEL